jgi:hypothetical protein
MARRASLFGYWAVVRTPLRLTTTDGAVLPAFELRPLRLASWHFFPPRSASFSPHLRVMRPCYFCQCSGLHPQHTLRWARLAKSTGNRVVASDRNIWLVNEGSYLAIARPAQRAPDYRARVPSQEQVTPCQSCGAYLKTYDGEGSETFFLADWTSLHLDVIACDRGLKRLAASLYVLPI